MVANIFIQLKVKSNSILPIWCALWNPNNSGSCQAILWSPFTQHSQLCCVCMAMDVQRLPKLSSLMDRLVCYAFGTCQLGSR